jgi:hypothetical protein
VGNLILGAVVPLTSVLVGAALTYWLNVRTRRRTQIEDLFNEAITAVAVADASRHYIPQVARPAHMTDEAYTDLLGWIARTTIENHTQRCAEAREAIARVVQYEPSIRPHYQDATAVTDRPEQILALLVTARDVRTRRRRPWRRITTSSARKGARSDGPSTRQ